MDPATIALLAKLAPFILKGASVVYGNIHSDISMYQTILLAQQVTQQEYYKTLRVYYQTQFHRVYIKHPKVNHKLAKSGKYKP